MRLRVVAVVALAVVTGAACGYVPASVGSTHPTANPTAKSTSNSAVAGACHSSVSPDASPLSLFAYYAPGGYPILVNQQPYTSPFLKIPETTWKLTRCGWVELAPPAAEVFGYGMVYDPALQMTVLIGAKTLGWDGSSWQSLGDSPFPTLTHGFYAAFDAARNVLVAIQSSETGVETWTFDGKDWTRVSTTGPVSHFIAAVAYDPQNKDIVLNGLTGPSETVEETWVWNGVEWSLLHPATSPPHGGVVMGFDEATQQLILVTQYSSTWTWIGDTWQQLQIDGPPLYPDDTMTYDSASAQLLLWEGGPDYGHGSQVWAYSGTWRLSLGVGQAGNAPSPSPTPAVSAAPTSQPTTLPSGDACRIPYSEISEASGGFIYYPSGRKVPDPSSEVALPGNTPGAIGVNPGLTYVPTLNRWVPVPRGLVAPSGGFYAYTGSGGIQRVTIADGHAENVAGPGWEVLGVTDTGVYADHGSLPDAYWIAFGAQPQQVAGGGGWLTYNDAALWRIDASGNLARHDVSTGVETNWGQVSQPSWITGFDAAGNPIIDAGGALIIHHADGTTVPVWAGTNGSAGGFVYSNIVGTFFTVGGGLVGAPGHGVYQWTAGSGARLISANEVNVMGPCEVPPVAV